jgi:hypothetical protein
VTPAEQAIKPAHDAWEELEETGKTLEQVTAGLSDAAQRP